MKNKKGGKERREIKWCFRAIDFERHRSKNMLKMKDVAAQLNWKEREV